jgi:hypothetical protein
MAILTNKKVFQHLEGNDAVKSKKEHEMAHAEHYDISGGRKAEALLHFEVMLLACVRLSKFGEQY